MHSLYLSTRFAYFPILMVATRSQCFQMGGNYNYMVSAPYSQFLLSSD